MGKTILVTGGAGFLGSHLGNELLAAGHRVRALDNLYARVHGPERRRPEYLDPQVELITGDIRDANIVSAALRGVDAVFHLAARIGIGPSMYEVHDFTDVNITGTAVLLEALSKQPVERLIVASSMSIYGEGRYLAADGTIHDQVIRTPDQLRARAWDPVDQDGNPLQPAPTPEIKQPSLTSVYALSKLDQERTALMLGQAYGIPTVALRYFHIYGRFQPISNPYSCMLDIFAARLLSNRAPMIFEDGNQLRDYLEIRDAARAARLALESPGATGKIFNIGSGRPRTLAEIARILARATGRPDIEPELTQNYRAGEIRHCFADISAAKNILNFEPQIELEQGLGELIDSTERALLAG